MDKEKDIVDQETDLKSYYEEFGKRMSMYQEGEKGVNRTRTTEYIIGNKYLSARTGAFHRIDNREILTSLDGLYGSKSRPKSTLSFFWWPQANKPNNTRNLEISPYRCSLCYYSINGEEYELLGGKENNRVHASYVLGAAVVKTIIEEERCKFNLYTFIPPELPVVCQYLIIEPKERIKQLSLLLYANPVMPERGPRHCEQVVLEDGYNDRITYKDEGFLFEDEKYNLKLHIKGDRKPDDYWCNNLNGVPYPARYYQERRHLNKLSCPTNF